MQYKLQYAFPVTGVRWGCQSQVLGFKVHLQGGGQNFCFYYVFKQMFPDATKFWGNKKLGELLPTPVLPPNNIASTVV